MSGTTGGPTPEGVNVLALGVDSGPVERGVQQARQHLGTLENAAERASQAWDGLLDALGDTAVRGQQVAPPLRQTGDAAEGAGERARRMAQALWESARAMTEARTAAIATQQSLAAYQNAARAATQAQTELNERLGVTARGQENYRARAEDIAAYGAELDRLRQKFNPLYAAGQQYRQGLEEIRRAQAVGAISAAEAAAAQDRLRMATQAQVAAIRGIRPAAEEAAGAVRLTGAQLTNLSYQIQDAAVQLSLGQNPLMILMQQGPQAAMAVGGVGESMRRMAEFVTPTRAAIGLLGATMAIFTAATLGAQSRLIELQQRLRATREDYMSLADSVTEAARAVAVTSGTSTSDARSAGQIIAGSRGFQGGREEIERLIRISADLARVTGTEVPAAADRMAKALADPARAARELGESGLLGFNDALRRNAELLVAQGDRAGAARLVIEQMARQTAGAAEQATILGRAWRAVENAITGAWQGLNRFAEASAGGLAALVTGIARGGGLVANEVELGGQSQSIAREVSALSLNSNSPTDIRAAVLAQARLMGVPEALAEYVARRESGFRQTDASGALLTSPAGAVGIMQLMPGTARELGANPADPQQNIVAGLRYLQQLLGDRRFQTNGAPDFGLVAGAYNAGPTAMAEILAGRRQLTPETAAYIAGASRLAVPGGSGQLSEIGLEAQRIGAAEEQLRGQDFRSDRLRILRGQAGTIEGALESPSFDQSSEAAQRYREALEKIRAEIVALEDPTEGMLRQQREAADLYRTGAGAARELAQAEQQAAESARQKGKSDAEAVLAGQEARRIAQQRLLGQLNDTLESQRRSTEASQAEAAALMEGATAMNAVADQRRAEAEALKYAAPGTAEYEAAVRDLTAAFEQQRAAAADLGTAKQALQSNQQLEYLRAELALVGASTVERQRELAALKARQEIEARGGDPNSDVSRQAIQQARQISDVRSELDRTQAAYNDLAAVGEQAFSRIGTAITQALANGQLQTLRFGNIAKAVFSEVLQYLAKLAVLNPIQNVLFGRNLPTIANVGGILGGLFGTSSSATAAPVLGGGGGVGGAVGGGLALLGGGAAGGYTGTSGLTILGGGYGDQPAAGSGGPLGGLLGDSTFSTIGNVWSIGSKALEFFRGGATGLTEALNPGTWSILQGTTVGGWLNTPLWGAIGPTQSGAPLSLTSLGGLAGGLLGGFGLGTIAGGITGALRGTADSTGTYIGTGVGTAAGAAIGSIIPGIGTVLGALIGGTLGGGAGGLFGPTIEGLRNRSGGTIQYGVQNGRLVVTEARGKRWNATEATGDAQAQLDAVNNELATRGIFLDEGPFGYIGYGRAPARAGVATEFNAESVLPYLRSNTADIESVLRNSDGGTLERILGDVDWVRETYWPAMTAAQTATDEFTASMRELDERFEPVIARARSLGLATKELDDIWAEARARLVEQRALGITGISAGLDAREARLAGNDTQAELFAFDQQARQEVFDTQGRLRELGVAAEQAAQTIERLQEVQRKEREEIESRERDARARAAEASAGGVVVSLADYARNLRAGAASPLSAQSQFSIASEQFDTAAAAAAGGDWQSVTRLTGYADTLLSAGRNLYGSGTAYVETFNRVLAAIEKVAQQPAEQLTAQVLRAETRTQTDVLKSGLDDLKSELAALRREVAQGSAMPARLVA